MTKKYTRNKISIIIPFYNSEDYISETIKSIINQTYSNYEIVCIDDGSDDKSVLIINDYIKQGVCIKLIHQQHKGVSAARLDGIRNATGEYLMFVDADDWIETDMLERMLNAFDVETDFVVCNFYKEYDGKSHIVENELDISPVITNIDDMVLYTYRRDKYYGFTAWLWNKMFRRELIERTGLQALKLGLHNGEDVALFTDLIMKSKKAKYLDIPLYHYRLKGKNIEERTKRTNLNLQFDALTAYEYAINGMERFGISQDKLVWSKRFYCYRVTRIIKKCIEYGDTKNISDLKEKAKKYLYEYEKTNIEYPERINEVRRLIGVDK